MNPPERALALYVHWPFCRARCPYCDFNIRVRARVDHARWRAALLAALDRFADETGPRTLASVFFGGGTPSSMDPETVAAIVERARERWRAPDDLEVSLEANPDDRRHFPAFARAGITRLSLGVQSLDDRALAALGRAHGRAEALAAIEAARAAFATLSFDLIYARPEQTEADWRRELGEALGRAGDQLSLYQLTFEPGTAFEARRKRGEIVPADETMAAHLYEITQAMTAEAGLPGYEISNHARGGRACRHNLVYWRYGDYVGIGPGAHGRLSLAGRKIATRQLRAPTDWLEAAERGLGTVEREEIGPGARLSEVLLMGLRLSEGVPRARIESASGLPVERALDREALDTLAALGLLELDSATLRATPAGRQRLDAVLARLLARAAA